MPRQKRTFKRRKKAIFAVKPTFMSKSLRQKRMNQVATKTFYFVDTGTISSTADGRTTRTWSPMNYIGIPPAETRDRSIPFYADLGDFLDVSKIYSMYKILCFRIDLFAANVGAEALAPAAQAFIRGNTVICPIVNRQPNQAVTNNILDLIGKAGCRMIPARSSSWSRTLYRPKGFPRWGSCDTEVPQLPGQPVNRMPDFWHGQVMLQGENATPGRVMWYYTMRTKVAFRGRTLFA